YITPEGTMEWKPIAEKSFNRHALTTSLEQSQTLGLLQSAAVTIPAVVPSASVPPRGGAPLPPGGGAPVPPYGGARIPHGVAAPRRSGSAAPRDGGARVRPDVAAPPGDGELNLSPLDPISGASGTPPLRTPGVSLAPGTALRRSSIRSQLLGN